MKIMGIDVVDVDDHVGSFTIDEVKKVVITLSSEWAQKYQREHKRGPDIADQLLNSPQDGLKFLLKNGFARAGAEWEKRGYGSLAVQALEESIKNHESYDKLLQLDNAPEIVWEHFTQICKQNRIGENQKLNLGVVNGLVKLAQNSVNHNPFKQLGTIIIQNPVDAYLLLRKIPGIGDKIAAFILRDIVTILDVEDRIAPEYRILLQPIDRWVDGIAKCLWIELGNRAPPWLVALKIIVKCKEYKCSPVRFNQGAWKYGSSKIINTKKIPEGINQLLDKSAC
jgi:hypothetical protein